MVRTVFGRRGAGKTTYIKKRILESERVFIVDFLGEYQDVAAPVYSAVDFVEFLEDREKQYYRVVYQPHDREPAEATEAFLKAVWISGNGLVVIDEIDMVSSPANVPHEISKNLNLGRHRNLDFIAASRRPAATPRLLTSVSEEIVFFNTSEPRDVKYAEEVTGSREFANKLRSIPQYHYLRFDAYTGEVNLTPYKEQI